MKYILPLLAIAASLFLLAIAPIVAKHVIAFTKDVVQAFKQPGIKVSGHRLYQGGFVTLLRNYGGYTAGQVVELPASTEAALIASGGATTSTGPATSGALTTAQTQGAGTFPAAAGSVTITNALVTPQSIIFAQLNQAAADGTLLYVARVVAAAGSFTVYGNANATAATGFDWAIVSATGTSSNPN